MVGVRRIELRLHAPEALYQKFNRGTGNRTQSSRTFTPLEKYLGDPGIEPGLHAPEACVLPVY